MPPPWGDRPVSFLRDIQPVLDRHCVRCHGGLKPAGGAGFLRRPDCRTTREVAGYGHNRAFETILDKGLVCLSPARAQDASITPPLAYGSLQEQAGHGPGRQVARRRGEAERGGAAAPGDLDRRQRARTTTAS